MTHAKNNIYSKTWREKNNQVYHERACVYSKRYADFKREQKRFFSIDPTLFL